MEEAIQKGINQLKNLLSWSDRLGSDEIYEINNIINTLNDY